MLVLNQLKDMKNWGKLWSSTATTQKYWIILEINIPSRAGGIVGGGGGVGGGVGASVGLRTEKK